MLHLLYNIRGVVSRNVIQCYIGWGQGQKFPIFALYNMCTTPLHIPVTLYKLSHTIRSSCIIIIIIINYYEVDNGGG